VDHGSRFGEDQLRRVLAGDVASYHRGRPHLSFEMDAPDDRRPMQLPDQGTVVAVPEVGGFHHPYERRAACDRREMGLREAPVGIAAATGVRQGRKVRVYLDVRLLSH
jgi:hypothetical protein